MSANHLDRIQRWMQAVVMHPGGVISGISSEDARRQFAVSPTQVEQVITRSNALTSIERLEVYANAYYARLLECLYEEFPALLQAVGEEAFDALAIGYLQNYPSTSYTLGQLGRNFPKYLQETRPTADVNDPEFEEWTDFLIDLATLERHFSEVFDGPGVEGQPLLDATRLAAVPPDRWSQARLLPACCLRLVELRFPVHEYITAVRHKHEPPPPQPAKTYLAVTRRDFVIRRVPLSRLQFELLSALVAHVSIGNAIGGITDQFDGGLIELADSLRNWFADWSAAGFFQSVDLPPRQ